MNCPCTLLLATTFSAAGPVLVDASVRSAVVLAAAALLTLAMRRASAAERHLVWLLALGSTLALPIFSALLPAWRILPHWPGPSTMPAVESAKIELPVPPQPIAARPPMEPKGFSEAYFQAAIPPPATNTKIEPAKNIEPPRSGPPHGEPPNVLRTPPAWWTRLNWEQGLPAVWLLGMAGLALRYGLGLVCLWRIGRAARPVEDQPWITALDETARALGVRPRVTLLESSGCTIPMTWGLFRPVVVLPIETGAWPVERRRVVLAHELAHVKRRDCLAQLIAQAVRALYWFNPLVWLGWRRLLAESERACDDLVLALGSKASDYAEHLLTVAAGAKAEALLSSTAVAMARSSRLQGRLAAILEEKRNRRRLTRLAVAAALLIVMAVVVPLSVLRAVADNRGADADAGRAADSKRLQPAEDERRTEARREAGPAAAEEANKKGEQAAATRHYIELVSLPNPPLHDCRQAVRHLESTNDWQSLAKAYEIAAGVMGATIAAPPQSFARPLPPTPPDARAPGPRGSNITVQVQTELDGVWQNCAGTAESWLPWITRKQRAMRQERFEVLCKLAGLYRDRLKEPKKVAAVLRKGLADTPFFTVPLEKLIADEWPRKKRNYTPPFGERDMQQMERDQQVAIHAPAARDLVVALVKLNDLDAAIDMQSRVVLADYWEAHAPYREMEKLWWLLEQRPGRSPLPRVACLDILSPERPSIEFNLDKFVGPKTWHKLLQLSIAARPGLEFDSLELAAEMESRGGYVDAFCQAVRGWTQPLGGVNLQPFGGVKWYKDQRKGREQRTSKFKVPAATGVIYFNTAWLPGTDPNGVDIHRITVKATFRKAAAIAGQSPFSAEALAAESAQAAALLAQAQAHAREALARAQEAAKTPREFTNSVGMKFRLIPAGEFMMGSTEAENAPDPMPDVKIRRDDEGPVHRVRITKPFYLGVYELTQAQWSKVMGTTPALFKMIRHGEGHGPNKPMYWVTWYDAVAFCNKLGEREGKKPYYRITDLKRQKNSPTIIEAAVTVPGGEGYRLPSEAQWEYACRAGTTTPYAFGKTLKESEANFSKDETDDECVDVGSYRPNAWGLYDMHGNVDEWCQDWRGWDYYRKSPTDDPQGPATGTGRVLRGGSFEAFAGHCRSAHRDENLPGSPMRCIGFRVAIGTGEPPDSPPKTGAKGTAATRKPVQAAGSAAGEKPAARPVAPAPSVRGAVKSPASAVTKTAAERSGDSFEFSGHVVGPDGKPIRGAKLYLLYYNYTSAELLYYYHYTPAELPPPVRATSGPDGSFRFSVAESEFHGREGAHEPWIHSGVVAVAGNLGMGWQLGRYLSGQIAACAKSNSGFSLEEEKKTVPEERRMPIIRLVRDDVPIAGRIVDAQGRPVAGATVQPLEIETSVKNDLTDWLNADKKTGYHQRMYLGDELSEYLRQQVPYLLPAATTDHDGRFRLAGIGRERIVRLQVAGPGIATERIYARTRPGATLQLKEEWGRQVTFYGPDFEYAARPSRPVVGVVRDKDTQAPLENVDIQAGVAGGTPFDPRDYIHAKTDARGRYRLTGMLVGEDNKLLAVPPLDGPYLLAEKPADTRPERNAIAINFELKRGVVIEGRVAADLKALQGPWKVVRVEKGKDADSFWAGVIERGYKIDLSDIDRLNFVEGSSVRSFNFSSIEKAVNCGLVYCIDPRAATKTIDLFYGGSHLSRLRRHLLAAEPGDMIALGIYEMDGDRLKICLAGFRPAKTEQRRPKRFAVERDSADALFVLERYRPPEDEKAIRGEWEIVKQLEDGKAIPAEKDRPRTCWFSDENQFSLVTGYDGGPAHVLAGRWKLDTAKQPKGIAIFARSDFAGPAAVFGPPPPPERFLGIYTFDGNGLQIAYRKGGPPPEKFESVGGSGVTLLALRRIEPPKPVHSSNAAETQGTQADMGAFRAIDAALVTETQNPPSLPQ